MAEAAEKNVAAITLRTLHAEHSAVMDAAMRIALAEREVTATGNLTVQARVAVVFLLGSGGHLNFWLHGRTVPAFGVSKT